MTDVLAKPTPRDVREMVDNIEILMSGRDITSRVMRDAVTMGIMMERRRCANIVDAECEWGGDIRECERKIEAGEGPRRIPGYNALSED